MKIRIGTRGSPLALAQAQETKNKLVAAHKLDPDDLEIVVIATTGDNIKDKPLNEIGGKGLFTKELEEGLLAGTIDLAVHSMKDMPAQLPRGLDFAAVLEREDPRDAFISLNYKSFNDLPQGAKLGSSSVRRTAQALHHRPDLATVQFRGNVGTRLRKLDEGVADATFLACAGLKRLGFADKITSVMPVDLMLPAAAQGVIAIETATANTKMKTLVEAINHRDTDIAICCERGFLQELDGSCKTPLAGLATLKDGSLYFRCEALSLDGKHCFTAERSGPSADADAEAMGRDAAREVKRKGGKYFE